MWKWNGWKKVEVVREWVEAEGEWLAWVAGSGGHVEREEVAASEKNGQYSRGVDSLLR